MVRLLLAVWINLSLLDASPVISEFLASNTNGITDEDGDNSDWIEIHNPGSTAVNLNGWHLSNDITNPTQWTFPSLVIPAGGYAIVYASGKDRRVAGQELHTNFSLDVNGEYLALIHPDGLTKATEFSPYPKQREDMSFGNGGAQENVLLESNARLHYVTGSAPSTDSQGRAWTEYNYDHSGWTSSASTLGGIGYDNGSDYDNVINTSVPAGTEQLWVRCPFNLTDPSMFNALMLHIRYDDGVQVYLNGTEVFSDNYNVPIQSMESSDFVTVDISSHLSLLRSGNNVLAFRVLNTSSSSSDLLLLSRLLGLVPVGGSTYFYNATPSPGTVNSGETFEGYVRDTKFAQGRGFYSGSFTETISTTTPGATLVYTTDGSIPTLVNGTKVMPPDAITAPQAHISIGGTTLLRVAAFREGWLSTNVDTSTYIFTSDVVQQNVLSATITESATWGPQLPQALRELPSIALTVGSGLSITEQVCSVEMIHPDGTTGFQVDAGIEIFGGHSLTFPKNSLRISFKKSYGPSTLKANLFDQSTVNEFDQIILRSGSHDSLFYNQGQAQGGIRATAGNYLRNRWVSDRQLEAGHLAPHGRFVHVYLNGNYHGQFQLMERPNAAFMASYLGGKKIDYDALNSGTAIDGDTVAWNALLNAADNDDYPQIQQYLDVRNFADYLVLQFYGGNDWDWNPSQNWYAARRRQPGAGYRFFVWDSDIMLRRGPASNIVGRPGPGHLWSKIKDIPAFKMEVADSAHRHFFNDGMLTRNRVENDFDMLALQIQDSVIAEMARWTDHGPLRPSGANDVGGRYTPDSWSEELAWLKDTFVVNRTGTVINQLRNAGVYPNTAAPVFSQHGGSIVSGFPLSISNPNSGVSNGTIYYTLDGTDPLTFNSGGTLPSASPTAQVYTSAVTLAMTTRVKARILRGQEWSALNEAVFSTGVAPEQGNLVVSEFSYQPADSAPGVGDGDDFEFIEIMNIGNASIDLTHLEFDQGVTFDFASIPLAMRTLAAGARAVIVEDSSAFQSRYGSGVTVLGQWTGKLDNGGETLRLRIKNGAVIREFTYNDKLPWPECADGDGYSLVLMNPLTGPDHSNPMNWRCSVQNHGNPGASDSLPAFMGNANGDMDSDGLPALVEHFMGTSDHHSQEGVHHVSQQMVEKTVNGQLLTYPGITFRRRLGTDDVFYQVEISTDLQVWESGEQHVVLEDQIHHGDGSVSETWRATQTTQEIGELFLRLGVGSR